MKQLTFILLIFTLITTVFGQKYLTTNIRSKADSILKTYIGDTVFYNYCSYNADTYYEYKNIFGKSHWVTLNKFKRTKGKFIGANIRWHLNIPYPKCTAYDTISGITSLNFDSLLRPTEKPNLNFIPDFYWKNQDCRLISKDEALNIAKHQNLKSGIDSLNAIINYDISKTFTWEVSQILWTKKDGFNNDYGEMERIFIDASTGEVKLHETVSFFPVY